MTGTIWSVLSTESAGNVVNWPKLNVRRQISIWGGFLDADDNLSLDHQPSQWPNVVEAINAKYGITADYPDMIGPDLEGEWSVVKLAGPSHSGWDHLASELARGVADVRLTYSNAEHINVYNLPYANKFSRTEPQVSTMLDNQRRLIDRVRPAGLTALKTILHLTKDRPAWFVPYYQSALIDCIRLGVEFDLTPVAQIGYRYTPNGGVAESFTLIPEDKFRQFVREAVRDAEWDGHRCVNPAVWDQTAWDWGVCQRTNPDGTLKDTTPRTNHIRTVLTKEFNEAGVEYGDPIALQAYWDAIANERYLWINEVMGWEIGETPPVVVPIEGVEIIERHNRTLLELSEAAEAASRDVTSSVEYQGKLIAAVKGLAQ